MTGATTAQKGWIRLLADARIAPIVAAADHVPVYLVGGAVRDAGLGRDVHDLDVIVGDDGVGISERIAAATGARIVALGGERFAAIRLVTDDSQLDIWDLRGSSLEKDLRRRDFTVNAIALALPAGQVFDPTGGVADLELGRLRATREGVFCEDSVRVLRLARLASTLDHFEADPSTLAWAQAAAPQLLSAPAERVRAELDLLLGLPAAATAVRWFAALDLATLFFGQGEAVTSAATATTATTATHAVTALSSTAADLDRWQAERSGAGTRAGGDVSRAETGASPATLALHWSLLAELFAPRSPASALRALKRRGWMSRASCDLAAHLAERDRHVPAGASAERVWLHAAGRAWPDAIALRFALARGAERAAWQLLDEDFRRLPPETLAAIIDPQAFVSGDEVQELLNIGPGPAVGAALAAVREAQVSGAITDRSEAIALLLARRRARVGSIATTR
ncbi:MAG: hypothetical protein ABI639_11160 [Thermoanaerobaculia bacterium]